MFSDPRGWPYPGAALLGCPFGLPHPEIWIVMPGQQQGAPLLLAGKLRLDWPLGREDSLLR